MSFWSVKRSSGLQFRRSNSRLRRPSLDFERLEERVVLANLLQNPGAELGLSGWTNTTPDTTSPYFVAPMEWPSGESRSFIKSFARSTSARDDFGRAWLTQRVSLQSLDLSAGGIARFGGDTMGQVASDDTPHIVAVRLWSLNAAGEHVASAGDFFEYVGPYMKKVEWTSDGVPPGTAFVDFEIEVVKNNTSSLSSSFHAVDNLFLEIIPRNAPDLVLTEFGFAATGSDQSIQYSYAVANNSLPRSATVALYWAKGSSISDAIGGPFYTAAAERAVGQYGPIQISKNVFDTPPAGATTLLLVMDPGDLVRERNESNNIRSLHLPNLVALSSETGTNNAYQWEPLENGGGFTFSYLIENPSRGPLPDRSIEFYWRENGQIVHTFMIDDGVDDAGAPLKQVGIHRVHVPHAALSVNRAPPPGFSATLVMRVDPDNDIVEVNEDDNLAQLKEVPLIVNIITHGWNSSAPAWQPYKVILDKMPHAGSILDGRVNTHVSNWDSNTGFTPAVIALAAAKVQEFRGERLWATLLKGAAFAAAKVSAAHATAAAKTIVADVRRDYLLLPDESQRLQKIQIFGHSRGAAVNARVANLLVSDYPNIVDFVSLDGFSTDWPNDAGIIGDISIVAEAAAPQGHKSNYRVQEGLLGVPEHFILVALDYLRKKGVTDAAISDLPLMTELLTEAFGDFRAPARFQSGFIDDTVEGNPLPSNHTNVHSLYFSNPTGFLGLTYEATRARVGAPGAGPAPPLRPDHVVRHDLTPTPAGPAPPPPQATTGFVDGSFEEIGALWSDARSATLVPTGDLLIDLLQQSLVEPKQLLTMLWDVTGDAGLVENAGNAAARLSDSAGDAAMSQFVVLPDGVKLVEFDLTVQAASAGDKLEVSYNGTSLQTIDLLTPAGSRRVSFEIPRDGTSGGMFTFALKNLGPAVSTIEIDNIEFLSADAFLGTEGDDKLTLRASADGSMLEIYNGSPPVPGSQPVFTWPMDAITPLPVQTLGGNDVIVVELPDGTSGPLGGLLLDAGSGSNSLLVKGGRIRLDSVATGGNVEIIVSDGGTLVTNGFDPVALSVDGAGSKATILPGGETSVLTALSVGDGATLDITDNAVVINYAGTSPAATVREQVLSGRGGARIANGTWLGTGITSSTAAQGNVVDQEKWSVGYAENAALPLGDYASFRGVAVDETAVLIAYTRTGDANLDGFVNDDDVTIIGANYAPGVPQPHWALGDFDYNGFVDDDDVTLLGAFYQAGAALTLPSPAGRGIMDAAAAPPMSGGGVRSEWAGAARETFGLGGVRGRAFDELSSSLSLRAESSRAETRAQPASFATRARQIDALSLPSPDLPSAGARRGVRYAPPAADELISDDEGLIDLLAESIAIEAANRSGGLSETGIALRQIVTDHEPRWLFTAAHR